MRNNEEDKAIARADFLLGLQNSQVLMRERLASMLAELTPREREVLAMRFGCPGVDLSSRDGLETVLKAKQ